MSKRPQNPATSLINELLQARKLVSTLQERLQNLTQLSTDIAAHLSDMPRSPSPDQQRMESILVKKQETEEELLLAKEHAASLCARIGELISRISNPFSQLILKRHYIDGVSVTGICKELYACKTIIYDYQTLGLRELDRLLTEELA